MAIQTIDITPDSLKTPEGVAKVNAALETWHDTQATLANLAAQNFPHFDSLDSDEIREMQDAIKAMHAAQEDFLRALAGR